MASQEGEEESKQLDASQKLELTLRKDQAYIGELQELYQGFWYAAFILHNVVDVQQHFQAQHSDIIVASKPKTGTTWLKALVFSVVHRTRYTKSNHPLLTMNPHELVLGLEFVGLGNGPKKSINDMIMMTESGSPRIFGTHIPYTSLPESIRWGSECKIVYMSRNPFDTVVSHWKFLTKISPKLLDEVSFEEFVDRFCEGSEPFGPYWDHVLGYWQESLERSNKILFLKYEDMQENGVAELKKLAEFLGFGFSPQEENEGVIDELLELCSMRSLKNLEVNKTGSFNPYFANDVFFRKGEVGDWVNHLTPDMIERLDRVIKEKFAGSGLEFKMSPKKY